MKAWFVGYITNGEEDTGYVFVEDTHSYAVTISKTAWWDISQHLGELQNCSLRKVENVWEIETTDNRENYNIVKTNQTYKVNSDKEIFEILADKVIVIGKRVVGGVEYIIYTHGVEGILFEKREVFEEKHKEAKVEFEKIKNIGERLVDMHKAPLEKCYRRIAPIVNYRVSEIKEELLNKNSWLSKDQIKSRVSSSTGYKDIEFVRDNSKILRVKFKVRIKEETSLEGRRDISIFGISAIEYIDEDSNVLKKIYKNKVDLSNKMEKANKLSDDTLHNEYIAFIESEEKKIKRRLNKELHRYYKENKLIKIFDAVSRRGLKKQDGVQKK